MISLEGGRRDAKDRKEQFVSNFGFFFSGNPRLVEISNIVIEIGISMIVPIVGFLEEKR